METSQQRSLRNTITAFICLLSVLIIVSFTDLYDRSKRPMRVFIVRHIHDTTYVAKPVTIVLNNKNYEVSLTPVRYVEEKFTVLPDNGDIAKAKRQERHDRTRDR